MKALDLGGNRMKAVPRNVMSYATLTYLSLSHNEISIVSIKNLTLLAKGSLKMLAKSVGENFQLHQYSTKEPSILNFPILSFKRSVKVLFYDVSKVVKQKENWSW